MKPSRETLNKLLRDSLIAIIAIAAWVVDGETAGLTGWLNLPPETTAALVPLFLLVRRWVRDFTSTPNPDDQLRVGRS